MQERVTKAVITASYNDDGKNGPIKDLVMDQVETERAKGYKFINHLFLRDTHDHRDTKFNFLIAGVPLVVYAMFNTARTSLEQVAVVGDDTTRQLVDAFVDHYQDPRFVFVDEGPPEDWSLSGTIRKGSEALESSRGELSLALMGDTPFAWNLEHVLADPDIPDNDAILDFNTKRKVGRHFPRYYHFNVQRGAAHLAAKEPNLYLFDTVKIAEIADVVYSGRKANLGKGRKDTLIELFVQNGKWKKTLAGLGPVYSAQLGFAFASKRVKPLVKPRRMSQAIQNALGLNIVFKADNDQPSTLEDMDAFEDWVYFTEMLRTGGNDAYPYHTQIQEFAQRVMPTLQREIPLYSDFEGYMNGLFTEVELPIPFPDGQNFEMPFKEGRYKRMIKGTVRDHRRYNRKNALAIKR